jgi:hypothetical protein
MADYLIGTFAIGAIPGAELNDALNEAVAEIAKDPSEVNALADLGVSRDALSGVQFRVDPTAGFVAETIILAIAIDAAGELTVDGIKALWRMVNRRVKKKKGDDAIGDEEDPKQKAEDPI